MIQYAFRWQCKRKWEINGKLFSSAEAGAACACINEQFPFFTFLPFRGSHTVGARGNRAMKIRVALVHQVWFLFARKWKRIQCRILHTYSFFLINKSTNFIFKSHIRHQYDSAIIFFRIQISNSRTSIEWIHIFIGWMSRKMVIWYDNSNNDNGINKIQDNAYTINLIDTFPNAASDVLKIIFDVFVLFCDVCAPCISYLYESTCSTKNISQYVSVQYQNRFVRTHSSRRAHTYLRLFVCVCVRSS